MATVLVISVVLGCASAGRPPLLGPPRLQPAVLMGRWHRQVTAIARDTVLQLGSNAVAVEESAGAPGDAREKTPRRSWWWVYASAGNEPARLCLHWRAGRHAAECRPFVVDSATPGLLTLHWGDREYVQSLAGEPPR